MSRTVSQREPERARESQREPERTRENQIVPESELATKEGLASHL